MTTPEPNIVVEQVDRERAVDFCEWAGITTIADCEEMLSGRDDDHYAIQTVARIRIEAVEAERERCAQIAEGGLPGLPQYAYTKIAASIRSTGKAEA